MGRGSFNPSACRGRPGWMGARVARAVRLPGRRAAGLIEASAATPTGAARLLPGVLERLVAFLAFLLLLMGAVTWARSDASLAGDDAPAFVVPEAAAAEAEARGEKREKEKEEKGEDKKEKRKEKGGNGRGRG